MPCKGQVKRLPSPTRPVVEGSADVPIYCLSLSNALDLDVSSAVLGKLQTNEHRCPAHPGGCERRAPDPTAGRLLSPAAAGKGLLDRVRFSAQVAPGSALVQEVKTEYNKVDFTR